jgi:hypothetical protein
MTVTGTDRDRPWSIEIGDVVHPVTLVGWMDDTGVALAWPRP